MPKNDEQILAMKRLGMTDDEIADVLACDKAIDRGERMPFDLSKEDEKAAKKLANAGTRKGPTAYNFNKRERKPNATKGSIIEELFKFFTEMGETAYENVEILNKERMIGFTVGENRFEVTLIQKRKPKN